MAEHSFIVTVNTSDQVKESVKENLAGIIEDWLGNVHTITKQPEKLISVSIITRIDKPTKTQDNGRRDTDSSSEDASDNS